MDHVRETLRIFTRRFGLLDKNCCTACGCEISLVQSHILHEIARRHKPSVQQIAEALGTDITTFSRQIQSLVRMKWVSKTPDPSDRRVNVLALTEEGERILESIDRQMNAYMEEVFGHLSPFERETVMRSLNLLNDAMSKSSSCCSIPIS